MKITGTVTAGQQFIKSNQVTIEGAKALISCLNHNTLAYITNILYVTDFSKAEALMSSAGVGNSKFVDWADVVSGANPQNWTINSSIVSSVTDSDTLSKQGNFTISDLVNSDPAVQGIRCKCQWDVGTWVFPNTAIYGLLLVLNGNLSTGQDSYSPTGQERVLAYLDLLSTPLDMSKYRNNSFTWDIKISVDKEEA